jgi:hypothetical protein
LELRRDLPKTRVMKVKPVNGRSIVGKGRDKGKMKMSAADLEASTFVQDLEDTDDDKDDDNNDGDEPVFLHETIAKRLADKYTYRSSSSSSIGSSSLVDLSAPTSRARAKPKRSTPATATAMATMRTKATLAQPPSPPREPVPVPDWLGKTAVLLQLKCCVICRKQWKKSDSGAARWVRFTCLSFVYFLGCVQHGFSPD